MQQHLHLACCLAVALLACSCKGNSASDSPKVADEATASADTVTARTAASDVCEHLSKLLRDAGRQSSGDCSQTMPITRQLDGPTLWSLRSECMMQSSNIDDAYRCNALNHPDWPAASGRYAGPSPEASEASQDEPSAATSLCEAARGGDLQAVKEFLKDPAQKQSLCPDELGENAQLDALMAAAVFGELQVVQFLVGEGFEPLKPDDTGRSAYVWAASGNHPEVVDFFWREGARPRPDDPFIGAVLYSAGLWNRQAVLDYYLAASADLDAEHYGYTALEGAAQGGHLDVVKWLVKNGANTEGALDQARTFRHEQVVAYLQSAAAGPPEGPGTNAR